jgi:hypothetical protein
MTAATARLAPTQPEQLAGASLAQVSSAWCELESPVLCPAQRRNCQANLRTIAGTMILTMGVDPFLESPQALPQMLFSYPV